MKKSFIFLISFCLIFCMVFTACHTSSPRDTAGTQSTTESTSLVPKNSNESTSLQTTAQSSSTATTAKKTDVATENPYAVGHTVARETKQLQTEIPELQEKIDRYNDAMAFPAKVLVQIGDQLDAPYIFGMACGMRVYNNYVTYPYGVAPSFKKIQEKENDLPAYIYSGIENVSILVDDEIYSTDYAEWRFDVKGSKDGREIQKSYDTLQEMYEDLPKGTYYVSFQLEIFGNYVYGTKGNYLGQESTYIVPTFILEIK